MSTNFIPNSFQVSNAVVDELMSQLSGSELKCYLTIIRKTKGWNKEKDAISISQLIEVTGLSNRAVINACNSLAEKDLIIQENGSRGVKIFSINICKKFTSEKSSPVKKVHSTREKSSQVTSEKSSHTKNNIKNTIQNTNNHLNLPVEDSHHASVVVRDELIKISGNSKQSKSEIVIDYQVIAQTYNDCVIEMNRPLPKIANTEALSDKRKRAIKKIASALKKRFGNCSTDAFRDYFMDFLKSARPFYFGENDRGWVASFDYLLREETLDKTVEGGL